MARRFVRKPDSRGPWGETPIVDFWLDPWVPRLFPPSPDDTTITVAPRHRHRPDLLAWEIWGDPTLWWVFAVANPDEIVDPIYDMEPGLELRIPFIADMRARTPTREVARSNER